MEKGILKNKNSYTARFWNPISKKTINGKTFPKIEEAEKERDRITFDFYKDKSYLLPSGITVNNTRRLFCLRIRVNGQIKEFYNSKNLQKVLDERKSIINQLIY